MNFMELNHRHPTEIWSTRHIGIYHQHDENCDFYILLHCSPTSALCKRLALIEQRISMPRDLESQDDIKVDAGNLHDLVLGCYIGNWRPYLRYVGEELETIVSEFF